MSRLCKSNLLSCADLSFESYQSKTCETVGMRALFGCTREPGASVVLLLIPFSVATVEQSLSLKCELLQLCSISSLQYWSLVAQTNQLERQRTSWVILIVVIVLQNYRYLQQKAMMYERRVHTTITQVRSQPLITSFYCPLQSIQRFNQHAAL